MISTLNAGDFFSKSWLWPWRSQLKLGIQKSSWNTEENSRTSMGIRFYADSMIWFEISDPSKYQHIISHPFHKNRTIKISDFDADFYDLIGRNPLKSTEIHGILQTCTASQGQTAAAKGGAVLVRWRSGFDTKIPMDMNQYLMFVLENIWYGQYLVRIGKYLIWTIFSSYWKISDMDNI